MLMSWGKQRGDRYKLKTLISKVEVFKIIKLFKDFLSMYSSIILYEVLATVRIII